MLAYYQLMVIKVFDETSGKNQVIPFRRNKIKKITGKKPGIMDSVVLKIGADVIELFRVINAINSISKLFIEVDHVVARYTANFDSRRACTMSSGKVSC